MRIKTLIKALKGELIKKRIDLCFLLRLRPGRLGDNDIVVSLTSYGRRVSKSVPYTIYYLFKQKTSPSRILLWLDEDHWNEGNIPWKLKFLCRHGLEIRFCKDIKSFKKLVYTLQLCPENRIVTADDDMLYKTNMIEKLSVLSELHPENIIALRFHQPAWEKQGVSFKPYRQWSNHDVASLRIPSLPTTGGGVLFPPRCFKNEVCNEASFMNLCPKADDVWFWAMSIYSDRRIFAINEDVIIPIDAFYQYLHKGSALEHENVDNFGNDRQIKAVLDYYNLWNKI